MPWRSTPKGSRTSTSSDSARAKLRIGTLGRIFEQAGLGRNVEFQDAVEMPVNLAPPIHLWRASLRAVGGSGARTVVPGRLGRGGAGPAAVYQWLASNPVLLGVASAAAWEGMKRAGKSLVGLLRRAKTRWSATKIHVSRGAAALIAADTIARLEVGSHPFLIEAVEEPTSIAGVTSPELNFVGIEPWLVFLVDLEGGVRWIIAVSSAGQVVGQMRIPLQELEASHYPVEG